MLLPGASFYIGLNGAAIASFPAKYLVGAHTTFEGTFIMSIRKSLVAFALAIPLISAFAMDGTIDKSIPLKDGSIVHQFKNGKMAMEDKYGRPTRVKVGESMTTADGTSITMNSDEVALLSMVIGRHYGRN